MRTLITLHHIIWPEINLCQVWKCNKLIRVVLLINNIIVNHTGNNTVPRC